MKARETSLWRSSQHKPFSGFRTHSPGRARKNFKLKRIECQPWLIKTYPFEKRFQTTMFSKTHGVAGCVSARAGFLWQFTSTIWMQQQLEDRGGHSEIRGREQQTAILGAAAKGTSNCCTPRKLPKLPPPPLSSAHWAPLLPTGNKFSYSVVTLWALKPGPHAFPELSLDLHTPSFHHAQPLPTSCS